MSILSTLRAKFAYTAPEPEPPRQTIRRRPSRWFTQTTQRIAPTPPPGARLIVTNAPRRSSDATL